MAWYDYALAAANPFIAGQVFGAQKAGGGEIGLDKAWEWGQKRPTAPQIGENPFMGDWKSLIGQLQQTSTGNGPMVSDGAYRGAADTMANQQMSMARGGTAGGARQAGYNMMVGGNQLASQYSNARLQEQLAARQQLTGALSNAGNAWFQPQGANLQAQLASPTNLQMLTGLISQLGMVGGTIAGGGAGAAAAGGGQGAGKLMGNGLIDPWG
jgi:hypothetical protein